MKTIMNRLFTFAFSLCLLALLPTYSQVTIGSSKSPNPGALLMLDDNTTGSSNENSSKGLAMPRVSLTALAPTTDAAFAASIGATGEWDRDAHIGLFVYNINNDYCNDTGIAKGLYVWNGIQWDLVSNRYSPDVKLYTDTRPHGGQLAGTTQVYPYRNFGVAGDWMLENLRYIPDANAPVQIIESRGDLSNTSK